MPFSFFLQRKKQLETFHDAFGGRRFDFGAIDVIVGIFSPAAAAAASRMEKHSEESTSDDDAATTPFDVNNDD